MYDQVVTRRPSAGGGEGTARHDVEDAEEVEDNHARRKRKPGQNSEVSNARFVSRIVYKKNLQLLFNYMLQKASGYHFNLGNCMEIEYKSHEKL